MTDTLPRKFDTPPCTCMGATAEGVRLVVLRDPFCPADETHRIEGTLEHEPGY